MTNPMKYREARYTKPPQNAFRLLSLLSICGLMLVSATETASPELVAGNLFSDDFSGTKLDETKWTPSISGSGEVTVGGGFVKIKSAEGTDESVLSGAANALALGYMDDWWVETRFAVLDETPFNSYNGENPRQYVLIQGGDANWNAVSGIDFRLLADASGPAGKSYSLAWHGMDNSTPTQQAEIIKPDLTKNAFHTLKAHRKADGNVDIYLDGSLLTTRPVINGDQPPAALRAGDLSAGNRGTLTLDYVRVGSSKRQDGQSGASEPIDIGDRRELFLDNLIVGRLEGGARRVFHKPVPREVVMKFDQPWEGNACASVTVFQDGDLYRMYYRGMNASEGAGGEKRAGYGWYEFTCYAESPDGIHWTRPSLGQVEFQGSKDNNIISKPALPKDWAICPLVPFRDENPTAAPDALYKAIAPLFGPGNNPDDWVSGREKSLAILKSPDGIHWSLMQENGVFRGDGLFDSHNVAFWDPNLKVYRAYYRDGTQAGRDIKTGTSPDFVNWSKGTFLKHLKKPTAQFYDNMIRTYHRAPHISIGLPTMYEDRPWSPAMEQLPDTELRRKNIASWKRPGPLSEVQLMWSRDGAAFELAPSTFMPPGPERPGTYTYSEKVAWHLVETASDLEGAAPELTLYRQEFYEIGDVQLRRYTLRLDGFASIHAPIAGGELITPPLIFKGKSLSMNFATSAFGSLRVEIQDADGKPIPGFTLADSIELYGDTVARNALWKDNPDLGALAGKPVRHRFVMKDADLYSIKFEETK